MRAYLDIVEKILSKGSVKKNRTGVDAISYSGVIFEHDMSDGYPLLTTKKMPFRLISSEAEFFIKGITDKEWLKKINNHIWDEWCRPDIVPYGTDERTLRAMAAERDLGPVYGWQWRHFGGKYTSYNENACGVDQLKQVVETLKKNPEDRRMIVSAWNPTDIKMMALAPCHYAFQITVNNGRLNLMWNQRSVDVALGLPFNIASYALLLHLFAKEASLKEGRLVGFLGDTHIYTNHVETLKEQLTKEPKSLPVVTTENWKSIFDWNYTDSKVINYESWPKLEFEIAV